MNVPDEQREGVEKLAAWAARHPDPARAGGAVAHMLSLAARVRRDATDAQMRRAHRILNYTFADLDEDDPESYQGDLLHDITTFNHRICQMMGWPY